MAKKRASKPQDETSASQTQAEVPARKGRRKKTEEPQGDVAAPSETAAKAATPKARSAEAAKGGAKKGAAPIKLNDRQREFLQKIKDAGEPGYMIGPKIEQRTINALQERKLVKRGAKDRESGNYRYALTKLGEKQLTTPEATA